MKRGKRCLAALLIVVLVFANAGPMAWAGESKIDDKVLFSIADYDLISEIKSAAAGRFEMGDVEFQTMDGDAEMFWQTFVEGGGVYELEPEISGGRTNVSLRLFVRLPDLPEDTEEEYKVTGEEEILLLYSNGTPGKVSCQTEIVGEHTRLTQPVILSGYKNSADEEENKEEDITDTEIENPKPSEKQDQEKTKENIETDNPNAADPEEKTEQEKTGLSSEVSDQEAPPAQADEAEPPADEEEIGG